MRKKLLIVFGTRPEAIKMAPVILELKKQSDKFVVRVCVTAQHRQMLDQVLLLFGLIPDFDLNIMQENQTLSEVVSKVLTGVGRVIAEEKPDMVLVQGDTSTTFAAGLAAFHARVPVGHIEAGLRTHDKARPFPEELNRQLTSRIADLHFCPTELSRQNLLREGIAEADLHVTGNTIIDALFMLLERQSGSEAQQRWADYFNNEHGLPLDTGKKLILVTGHRRENFGEGFENICRALNAIASRSDVNIVYPVHLNPSVQEPVRRIIGNNANIKLIPPLDYEPFVYLMSRAYLILTDSGGIQEEAPSLGKPVLVFRGLTERPEAVDAGTVRLVGTDAARIIAETELLLSDGSAYDSMARAHNPYGDGMASKRISDRLAIFFLTENKGHA